MTLTPFPDARFNNPRGLEHPHEYWCAWCATGVTATSGTVAHGVHAHPFRPELTLELEALLLVCPTCTRPTYIEKPRVLAEEEAHELFMQMPSPCPGQELPFLPGAVQSLYEEARRCFTIQPTTAANAAASLVHTASMLRMLYLRPEAAE